MEENFAILNKRIEEIRAKEQLGLLLSNDHIQKPMLSNLDTNTLANASAVDFTTEELVEVNILLLKKIKKLEKELADEKNKVEKELKSLKNKFQKELEVARNEKATNLEIRRRVDKLPGTHYQLQEKLETLDALVEFAKRLYKIKAFVNEKEGQSGEIIRNLGREFSGKYNLSLVAEYLKELIDLHPEKVL